MRQLKELGMVLGLAGGLLVAGQTPAHAVATIGAFDGTTAATCADGAACDVTSGTPGLVTWVTNVGNFNVTVQVGTSNSPGESTHSLIDLTYQVQALSSTTYPITLTLFFSDTDFTSPSSPPKVDFNSGINGNSTGTGGTTIEYRTFLSNSNTLFGLTAADNPGAACSFCVTDASAVKLADSGMVANPINFGTSNPQNTVAPYGLTLRIDVTLNNSTQKATGDSFIQGNVPEPASLLLLGSGLAGLGLWGRKRLNRKAN